MHRTWLFRPVRVPRRFRRGAVTVRIVFLDHVQILHIHAVRANFHIMFSVGIYSDAPSPGPGLGPSQQRHSASIWNRWGRRNSNNEITRALHRVRNYGITSGETLPAAYRVRLLLLQSLRRLCSPPWADARLPPVPGAPVAAMDDADDFLAAQRAKLAAMSQAAEARYARTCRAHRTVAGVDGPRGVSGALQAARFPWSRPP